MLEETLKKLNLTEKETAIYIYLLKIGPSLAPQIITNTGINRTNVYTLLTSLISKGLITEKKELRKRKTIYAVSNPTVLNDMLDEKEEDLHFLKKNFSETFENIKQLYESSTEKPIVQIFSGLKGVKTLYDRMLTTKGEVLIFVSKHDRDIPEHGALVEKNMVDRAKAGISVRALNAYQEKFHLLETIEYLASRKKMLIDIRLLPSGFVFPSQIIIFDNCVGITSLKKDLTTTIIENDNIAATLKMVFNLLWEAALPYHQKLLRQAADIKANN